MESIGGRMNPMRYAACAVCVAGLLASACGGISDPSKNITVDFMDTIQPFGVKVYEFDVKSKTGEYSATFIAVSPNPTTVFGIFLGQLVSAACTPIGSGFSGLNRIPLSGQISKGH